MTLALKSVGRTKLWSEGNILNIAQDGLANFKIKPGKIIVNKDYIFCDTYTFKKGILIPVVQFYFNGNGTANIDLNSQTHTQSGITRGQVTYPEYLASLVKVLNLSEVSAMHQWSACKSSVTDEALLTQEQNACLTGMNFPVTGYNLQKAAPIVVSTLKDMTGSAESPIGIGVNKSIYSINQSGVTSNIYYTTGVKLTWGS